MTEMVNGEGQNFQSSSAVLPVTPSSPPQNAAPEVERTFKQSEVNDIASRRASEAVERFKRESSIASHQQPQQSYVPSPSQQQPHTQPQQPQPRTISDDDVRRMAAEEAQRLRNEWITESHRSAQEQDAQRIASEFFTKVGTGDGGMQSFEKAVSDAGLDLRSIPFHVQLANMVDNTREVMLDLVKNPTKIGAIQNLIDIDLRAGRQPNLALAEMKRLAKSIKDNEQGSRFQSPNEPLSQMRPSNAGTDNKGDRSVKDYRNNPRYRI
jgi:hypothetical protein